jgi:hypothetical protein
MCNVMTSVSSTCSANHAVETTNGWVAADVSLVGSGGELHPSMVSMIARMVAFDNIVVLLITHMPAGFNGAGRKQSPVLQPTDEILAAWYMQ